ncbi:hypothetical protein V5O48_012462 [Marasmius crinis-equi]|uniref:Uncharacterized protein n=1 Tax=Marasmius crinis-equi TaxID=585013 RepID=A0ABR3F2S2_9AGAR
MVQSSSSSGSLKSPSIRPRRPPSPVSLYGAGAFGAPPPKPARPLPHIEKKPKRESVGHERTPSTSSINTSRKSEDSASSRSASNGSIKSVESLKNLGVSGWRKKRTSISSSLPTSPMPHSSFKPMSNKPRSHLEDEDFIPSEAETLVRQLDKATRTFGERVPVEFILRGKPPSSSQSQPTSASTPVSEIPPVRTEEDDFHLAHNDIPVTNSPPSEDIYATASCRPDSTLLPDEDYRRPDSPVLSSQDYHYMKKTRTLAPIATTAPLLDDSEPEEASPILFSQLAKPPLPPPTHDLPLPPSLRPSEHPDRHVPLLLRQPRPKYRSPSSPPPTTSHVPTPLAASKDNATGTTPATTPTRQAHPNPIRPKASHAGHTPFEGSLPRPDSPFQNSAIPFQAWMSTTWPSEKDPSQVLRQDCGQGWSGEWNRSDMQDVISKLRQLK